MQIFVTINKIYKLKLKAQLVYYRITVLLSRTSCFEALTAVNGSVAGRLERKLCFAAAFAAGSDEVLTLASFSILSLVAASLTALGLILEAFFSIELLLTCCEHKFLAAISALEGDVLVSNFLNAFNFYFIFAHCLFYLALVLCKLFRHSAFTATDI